MSTPVYADILDTKVVESLRDGGVGVIPTDTIYGIVTTVNNQASVDNIHRLKHRLPGKKLIILAANINQLADIGFDQGALEGAKKFWPASVTIELSANKLPEYLSLNTGLAAARIPDQEKLRQLLEAVGPIVAPSANIEGEDPAQNIHDAKLTFSDNIDFYVDAGKIENQKPSTLIRISLDGKVKVLRRGIIDIKEN